MQKPYTVPFLLLVTILLAFCSILYQLLLAQTLTEIYGNSVSRYAFTIGLYLFSMGLGVVTFPTLQKSGFKNIINLEIWLSIVGVSAIFILFGFAFLSFDNYLISLILGHSLVVLIGFLSGLEIPFLVSLDPQKNFTRILAFDFLGTTIGALTFPLVLYSLFEPFTISFLIGSLNLVTALAIGLFFGFNTRSQTLTLVGVSLVFMVALSFHKSWGHQLLSQYFLKQHAINWRHSHATWQELAAESQLVELFRTPYQRVMVIKDASKQIIPGHSLYLDKSIQLQDWWIKPYHETLSLISTLFLPKEQNYNIAILGGGDGILAKHLLANKSIQSIAVIDIDKEFRDFIAQNPHYKTFGEGSLKHPKVTVHNVDAFAFMRHNSLQSENKRQYYDAIILDLPGLKEGDKLMHLYSKEMFSFIERGLKPNGVMTTWHYSDKDHKAVLEQTLWESGFKELYYTCAYPAPNMQTQYGMPEDNCIEMFLIATKQSLKQNLNPAAINTENQAYWLETHYQSDNWKNLRNLNVEAHSVFKPNYNLLPPR